MVYTTEIFPDVNGAIDDDGNFIPLSDIDDSFGAEYPTPVSEEVERVKVPQPYKPGPLEKRFDTLQETMDANRARLIVGAKALDAEMDASLAAQSGETREVSTQTPAPRLDYKTGPAVLRAIVVEAARKNREAIEASEASSDTPNSSE